MSFIAYSHVFALILASLLLLSLPDAASGAQQNVTVLFNSTQISFTAGWRVAEFTRAGRVDKFAFANNPGEQLIVQLPRNVTTLSYRGFKIKGGAQYFVCLDCDEGANANSTSSIVDAHDESDNGTQPPVTLFQVKEVDPTQTHVLRVINLEDDRFNDTSQITFDSLVLTLTDTVSPSGPAGSPTSTTSPGATSTTLDGSNPTTTVTVGSTGGSSGAPSGTSTSKPPTPSVNTSQSATSGAATTSTSSSNPQGPTAPVSGGGASASQTQPSSSLSATSSGSQPQTVSSTIRGVTGSGGSQPVSTAGSNPDSGSSSGTSSGPTSSSSSSLSNTGSPNGGVSKTVIIVVAVIASLFVLALLAAITWLLVRNQPSPRGDVEGTAALMRQAAPAAGTGIMVSGPLPLSPMRPEIPNPFVDPLDDTIQSPPPRPPPPPVPPRSPLRTNASGDRPAWLTRTPRTPSPEASTE